MATQSTEGTEGIESIVVETHNWGKTAKFFQALGFEIEFETDHNSGQLRNGDGPAVFVAEVPESQVPEIQIVLKVADADAFAADPAIVPAAPFEDSHWGTRESLARDPDGRNWRLSAPAGPETPPETPKP